MSQQNSLGYNPQEQRIFRRYGLYYLIFFSLLYMAVYCTRLNLLNASAVMMDELSFTKSDIGVLTSVLFWTYGLGQLVAGRMSEMFGEKRIIFVSVVASCVMSVLMGFQKALLPMAILWGINGAVQSLSWAPGMALLTKWYPGNRRGFATGFVHAFSGFGQAVATLSVTAALAILPAAGFRSAFFLPPILPLFFLVFFLIFVKSSPKAVGLPEYKEEDPEKAANEAKLKAMLKEKGAMYPYKYLLTNRGFMLWMVSVLLGGLARYGLTTWIPLYFVDKFGVDITEGLLQSLMLPVGMGIGTFVVPVLTDKTCPNDRRPAVIVSALVGAAAVVCFLFLDPRVPFQKVLIAADLFVTGFCIYACNGTGMTYATDMGGRIFGGTCTGLLNFSAYMGAALQSLLYGFLLERFGWSLIYVSVAMFCVVMAVLAKVKVKEAKPHA